MTKQTIKIEDFEDKKTKANKAYTRFKTSEGWMSCFDSKSIEGLKKMINKDASCDIAESGDFKNIKKYYGEGDSQDEDAAEVEVEKIPSRLPKSNKEMYVSYAKDCFCAIISRISQAKFDNFEKEDTLKLMDIAVKAVKKAAVEF